jgi:hypothetical protein
VEEDKLGGRESHQDLRCRSTKVCTLQENAARLVKGPGKSVSRSQVKSWNDGYLGGLCVADYGD